MKAKLGLYDEDDEAGYCYTYDRANLEDGLEDVEDDEHDFWLDDDDEDEDDED